MKVFGIDISVWQRGIDMNRAKAEGVKFAICRAMYGNAKDTEFETNYAKVKNSGLGVGAYQWGRARNKAQAKEEAELLIKHCLKGKKFDYPIYYDVEDSIMLSLSRSELTAVIETWCNTMESNGYFAGIYMSESTMESETEKAKLMKRYSSWIAAWCSERYKPVCQMWQFGGETNLIRSNRIAGLVCDQDYAYVDFPKTIKEKGLNGYMKVPSDSDKTPKKEKYALLDVDGVFGYESIKMEQIMLNAELGLKLKVDGIEGEDTNSARQMFINKWIEEQNKK